MRTTTGGALFCACAAIAAGCILVETPKDKLTKGVYDYNEGLRWGRMEQVRDLVAPDAYDAFVELHAGWGEQVRISDVEVVRSTYDDAHRRAEVTVRYAWYRADEMVAYQTTVVQQWEYGAGRWQVVAEKVVDGQPFTRN